MNVNVTPSFAYLAIDKTRRLAAASKNVLLIFLVLRARSGARHNAGASAKCFLNAHILMFLTPNVDAAAPIPMFLVRLSLRNDSSTFDRLNLLY